MNNANANSTNGKTAVCQICGKKFSISNMTYAASIRPSMIEIIVKNYSQWSNEGYICTDDLAKFRQDYVQHILETEKGELDSIDSQIVKSLANHKMVARNVEKQFEQKLTFGQRLSDKLATFGGSWTFLIIFAVILAIWVILNSVQILFKTFDPYPFILLNLFLSCLAAIQAPIIMMSQNRKDAKDRMRSEYDYIVNMKAEVEIRNLHEKIDHMIQVQWQRLIETQQLQIELLEEMKETARAGSKKKIKNKSGKKAKKRK